MIPKDLLKFAEGIQKYKTLLDDTAALEEQNRQAKALHDATLSTHQKALDTVLAKIQDAETQYAHAAEDLHKRQAEFESTYAAWQTEYDAAKAKHDKALQALHVQAQSTMQSLNYEKAQSMKALTDAKTLHQAEMAAMGAEKAKLDLDLNKLRELRQKMLSQLQTGV